jgi:hypothetical protein
VTKPFSVSEVAAQLGVSENRVCGWVRSCELVHLRFGGRGDRVSIHIEHEALEAFIISRRQSNSMETEIEGSGVREG